MMDNRIFNVNGKPKAMLRSALALAFWQEGERTAARAYIVDPVKGMILLWHPDGDCKKFDRAMGVDDVAEFVWDWLKTKPATECVGWDRNYSEVHDTDVWSERGWRVYCEDWGHVAGNHYAIAAVKPAFMWIGK